MTLQQKLLGVRLGLSRVISGYELEILLIVAALAAGRHALLTAVPGTGKTTLSKALARLIGGARFHRIQFTPDMMPSAITGSQVFHPVTGEREIVFGEATDANILLADEVNRTPPKTQSALLEMAEEGQVTIAGQTKLMQRLFFIIATQNPIEQAGAYELAEAFLDRFGIRLNLGYISKKEEVAMAANASLHRNKSLTDVEPVISVDELLACRDQIIEIEKRTADEVMDFMVRLARATRPEDAEFAGLHKEQARRFAEAIALGAGPRAAIALNQMAAALTFLDGRDATTFADVRLAASPVLGHRLILTDLAGYNNITPDTVIRQALRVVPDLENTAKDRKQRSRFRLPWRF